MNRLKSLLISLKTSLKSLFFLAITVLVIYKLYELKESVSLADLERAWSQLPWWSLVLMIFAGLMAVVPMLFYDLILNKQMKTGHARRYILETSWAINTINNLAGFAGLVDIGLRYSFYSEDGQESSGFKSLSKLLPYFMSGLSLLSGFIFLVFWFFPIHDMLRAYWLLLLGIFLYLPFIFFISSRDQLVYFGQVPLRTRLKLLLTSTSEWLSAMLVFVLVAYLLGVSLPFYNLVPLYFLAVIMGIFSMIPGGIGTFDLIVITGLTSMGVSQGLAVSILLIYRVVYYIIPFFFGLIFFVKHMGERLNSKYFKLSQSMLLGLSHALAVLLMRFVGIFMIFSTLIPEQLESIPLVNRLDPIQEQLIWQFPSLFFGTFLIVLSRLVRRRVKASLGLSLFVLVLSLIYVNLSGISWALSLLLVVTGGLLVSIRGLLKRTYFVYSWEDRAKDLVFLGGSLTLLLYLGGHHFRENLLPHLNQGELLMDVTKIWINIGVMSLVLGLGIYLLLKRLAPKTSFGQAMDDHRFTQLLKTYGGPSESALAYLHDKRLFWYRVDGQDQVVFQFAQQNNKCVVMGNAIGNPDYIRPALQAFLQALADWNLKALFYEVDQELTLMLHDYGFEFMKFGENAMVDLAGFSMDGKHGKKFRKPCNRVEKAGFTFDILQPPYSDDVLKELRLVSDAWLNGRHEKGFSLGFFDEVYLQQAPIAVVTDAQKAIVAFANIMPTNNHQTATIDLMRYDYERAPEGIMDYLFVQLFHYFQAEGKAYFDMGMAPLANVGTEDDSFLEEKIANIIYVFTQRFYSFSGLKHYKEKFSPIWSPKYVVYPKKTWLLLDVLAIFKIDNRKIREQKESEHT